jgi:hypothetical protein
VFSTVIEFNWQTESERVKETRFHEEAPGKKGKLVVGPSRYLGPSQTKRTVMCSY